MADKIQLEFLLAPKLPLNQRLVRVALFLIAGFAIQFSFSLIIGWTVFFVGCLLAMMKGKSNRPAYTNVAKSWKNTTIEELQDIVKLSDQIKGWRGKSDTFRGSSGKGCLLMFLSMIGVVVVTAFLSGSVDRGASWFSAPLRGGAIASIWLADALTAMIPIWLAGTLTAWEPEELPRKARYLLRVYEMFKSDPNLEFVPSLEVALKNDTSIPTDARILIRIKDAPADFIGVQVQISLNDVQGKKYPYCYCVILSKKEYPLKERSAPYLVKPEESVLTKLFRSANDKKEMRFKQFSGTIVDITSKDDVNVIVMRQVTIGTGYYTTEDQALAVTANALGLTRKILQSA